MLAAAKPLTVERMIATVLLSIDQDLAAKVLRGFSDDSLDKVTRAMQELQEMAVDRDGVRSCYASAVKRMRQGGVALGDVGGMMKSVLLRAFGEERSADVTRRANSDILAKRPFVVFESIGAEDLAQLLAEEHPQIAAVFLAHIDRKKGGEVLQHLEEDSRADLVQRVATLDRTPVDVVQRVLEVMRKKVKDRGLTAMRSDPASWIKAAASLLSNLGGGDKAVLDKIEVLDAEIAAQIREQMFTFDDIQKLDKKSIQKILSSVDSRQLAMSLKAVTPTVEQVILGNLSKRAAETVREERDNLGPTPLSEVLATQGEILKSIRGMIDKGEIKSGASSEQMV